MRFIDEAILQHLDKPALTLTRCLALITDEGIVHGITTLDRDVTYRNITYRSVDGFEASTLISDNDQAVDHSEALALVALEKTGLTAERIKSGYLNDARWELHEVDYQMPSIGFLLDGGVVGVTTLNNNQSYRIELLSSSHKLASRIGCVDSLRCRAVFGSPAKSIYGCGVDISGFWKTSTVAAVDVNEPTVMFRGASETLDGNSTAARVQFLSGRNKDAGLFQVEKYTRNTRDVLLVEETPYPIEVGDEFRIRFDCNKTFAACRSWGNHVNYKGEPHIPVADGKEAEWAQV